MFGLGEFLVLAVYLAVVWILAKRVRSVWKRVTLFGLAAIAPIADSVVGHVGFVERCQRPIGVVVHRTITNAEGYLATNGGYISEFVAKKKFKFIESARDGFKRLELDQHGKLFDHSVSLFISKYEVVSLGRENVFLNTDKLRTVVRNRSTGEIYSEYVELEYLGGWAERIIHPTGPVAKCPEDQSIATLVMKSFSN